MAYCAEAVDRRRGQLACALTISFATLCPSVAFSDSRPMKLVDWVVFPGESVDDVVSQLGVSLDDLCAFNPKWNGEVRAFDTLPVTIPEGNPIRALVRYTPQSGETVNSVAERFGVSAASIRTWNHVSSQVNEFPSDTELLLAATVSSTHQGIDENGEVFSSRIRQPTHIGSSSSFSAKRKQTGWGTLKTVLILRRIAAEVSRRFPESDPLSFGDLSKKWGGRLPPHASHRRGDDVDIATPLLESPSPTSGSKTTVDIERTWDLVRGLVATGAVEYVFIDYRLQKELWDHAVQTGLSESVLAEIFQYPDGRRHRYGIVRHSPGHFRHIHVRFAHDRQNISTVVQDELMTGEELVARNRLDDAVPGSGRTVEKRGRCLQAPVSESNSN